MALGRQDAAGRIQFLLAGAWQTLVRYRAQMAAAIDAEQQPAWTELVGLGQAAAVEAKAR